MPDFELRSRPLSGTERDRRLWVGRRESLERVQRALSLGFNTLVVGDPGGGVTSLLNVAAAEAGRREVRAWASRATTATELLDAIADAFEPGVDAPRSQTAQAALARLATNARLYPDVLVVVDDVRGAAGHDVFGRMRDELWELDLLWLVGAHSEDALTLLAPPAESFFETVERLPPLTRGDIMDLLARRIPAEEIGPELRERIAERSEGSPARAMRLARGLLLRPVEERASALVDDPVDAVTKQLGEPAARLYTELLKTGPASPSDLFLLARMGWSRARAYQVFQALEQAGFVRAYNERSGGTGRPRKLYEVVDA